MCGDNARRLNLLIVQVMSIEAAMIGLGSILKSQRIPESRSCGQSAALPVYPLRL
jgi:hypothetical protein